MKNFFEKIKSYWQVDHEKVELRPARDWMIVVGAFLGLLLLSGGLHFYLYTGWLSAKVDDSATAKLPTIDTVQLQSVIAAYQQRQKDFQAAGSLGATMVDPSL
jgi:hypothetical protein